jgi:acyl-homoserine lactone acylase PvdQ
MLKRCAPAPAAAALFGSAGIVVLDGSRRDCAWARDPGAVAPGLITPNRLPVLITPDWVQNSNDSYWLSNPDAPLVGVSPLVGPVGTLQSLRTRSGIMEIRARLAGHDGLAGNRMGPTELRSVILRDRNLAGALVMDDLVAACKAAGASLSAEASEVVRAAGFAADVPLGVPQSRMVHGQRVALHGGDEFEGVLNKLQSQGQPTIEAGGYRINYGSSYIQVVTFDDRGPVAQGILTYGQSSEPDSPHAYDQLPMFAAKQWQALPFHRADVETQRIGPPLRLDY